MAVQEYTIDGIKINYCIGLDPGALDAGVTRYSLTDAKFIDYLDLSFRESGEAYLEYEYIPMIMATLKSNLEFFKGSVVFIEKQFSTNFKNTEIIMIETLIKGWLSLKGIPWRAIPGERVKNYFPEFFPLSRVAKDKQRPLNKKCASVFGKELVLETNPRFRIPSEKKRNHDVYDGAWICITGMRDFLGIIIILEMTSRRERMLQQILDDLCISSRKRGRAKNPNSSFVVSTSIINTNNNRDHDSEKENYSEEEIELESKKKRKNSAPKNKTKTTNKKASTPKKRATKTTSKSSKSKSKSETLLELFTSKKKVVKEPTISINSTPFSGKIIKDKMEKEREQYLQFEKQDDDIIDLCGIEWGASEKKEEEPRKARWHMTPLFEDEPCTPTHAVVQTSPKINKGKRIKKKVVSTNIDPLVEPEEKAYETGFFDWF